MGKSSSFLIDTEIFIWGMESNPKLSPKIKKLLENPENQVFLSVVSVWEIVIKQAKGRLKLPKSVEEGIKLTGFKTLSIELVHVLTTGKLPMRHKDPFDRILIAQARVENLTFITTDEKIWKYDLPLLKV